MSADRDLIVEKSRIRVLDEAVSRIGEKRGGANADEK